MSALSTANSCLTRSTALFHSVPSQEAAGTMETLPFLREEPLCVSQDTLEAVHGWMGRHGTSRPTKSKKLPAGLAHWMLLVGHWAPDYLVLYVLMELLRLFGCFQRSGSAAVPRRMFTCLSVH